MTMERTFKEYVAKKFKNNFWIVAKKYVDENLEKIKEKTYRRYQKGSNAF